MRRKDARLGMHVEHVSGEYLGVITEIGRAVLKFDGPRNQRQGRPYEIAAFGEVRPTIGASHRADGPSAA